MSALDSQFEPFRKELRRRYNAGETFDDVREEAVSALVAIANFESPLSVYYFGEPENILLDAVLDSAPGAEVFFVQPWAEGDLSESRISPGLLTSHLNFSNHRGFSRVLAMPAGKGLKAVQETDPHAFGAELAIIDRSVLGDEFDLVFGEVLHTLVDGGAIILIDRQNRAPIQADFASVFMGRFLSQYKHRLESATPERRPPFSQSVDEMDLGSAFDVMAMPSGSVHVIRKRPADKAFLETPVAAG